MKTETDKSDLAAPDGNAVPDAKEFRLVPVEPTEEMIAAASKTPGIKAMDDIVTLHQVRLGFVAQWPGDGSPLEQAWRAMLAASPALPIPAQQWQPIESAPQNGTDVLACFNSGHGAILIARTPGTGQWWTGGLTRIQTPTHWMPLPSPPLSAPSQQHQEPKP